MKLYELTQNYRNLIDLLEDESIPVDEIMKGIQQVDGEIVIKASEMAKLLKNIDADITAFKAEETRLKNKRQTLERKYDGIKDYLEEELKKTGIKKIDGVVPLSFRKAPASVNVIDENEIPCVYFRPKEYELDKKSILQDLKNGETVPGVELVTDKEYLKIG